MRKKINSILVLVVLSVTASCARDEVGSVSDDAENLSYTDFKRTQMTEAEMLQKGWKIVDEFKLPESPVQAVAYLTEVRKSLLKQII